MIGQKPQQLRVSRVKVGLWVGLGLRGGGVGRLKVRGVGFWGSPGFQALGAEWVTFHLLGLIQT